MSSVFHRAFRLTPAHERMQAEDRRDTVGTGFADSMGIPSIGDVSACIAESKGFTGKSGKLRISARFAVLRKTIT